MSDSVISDAEATTVHIASPLDCSHARAEPAVLWPPDHRFVPVSIEGVVAADGKLASITVTKVTENESGRADRTQDAIILPSGGVALRAERSRGARDRVYTVWFTARDGQSSCDGTVEVRVTHDERHNDHAAERTPRT